jgi:uncharacterized protein YndB with AHSA1/START domain
MPASPDKVFSLITDPARLPSWNRAITEVVEAPDKLELGSVWRIRLHALSQSWVSKSQVSAIDPVSRMFSYRSQTDDGNPSYADWGWHVESDGEGSRVTVKVELHPTTFWRKHLLVKVRRPALRKEMVESLNALDGATRP